MHMLVQGVERCITLLRDEFMSTMRLMGVTRVADISPAGVDATHCGDIIGAPPIDAMALAAYVPLRSKI